MNKDFARGMIVSMALKALPVRKKSPIAYLYNGVRLPALPEWDREAYPYAVIFATSVSAYLYIGKSLVYRTTSSGSWQFGLTDALISYCKVQLPQDGWDEFWEAPLEDGASWNNLKNISWTNTDILNEDGSIYLAGSDPIPIYNEPVNYLYNGVKLPKLPEWDKTVYPYATLRYQNGKDSSTTEYIFLFVTAQDYSWKSSYELQTYGPGYVYRYLIDGGTEWEYVQEIGSNSKYGVANYFFWTTHNILNKDGNAVYLAASEPVPVYE